MHPFILCFLLCVGIVTTGIHLPTEELAMPQTDSDVLSVVRAFNEAWNRHDLEAVMALVTDDCVFENTHPPPDGARYSGKEEVKGVWQKFFAANPDAFFETEEMVAAGDHCVVRWRYLKTKDGKPWHLRGVDIFKVNGGKIAAKLSYVKG